MAKERMITRTINTTIVTVKGYNRKTKEFEEKTDTFTGKFDDSNELEIFAHFDGIDFRTMEILSVKKLSQKRAQAEWFFIQNSVPVTDDECDDEND